MDWIRRIAAIATMLAALAVGTAQLGSTGAGALGSAPGGSVSTGVGNSGGIVGLFNAATP